MKEWQDKLLVPLIGMTLNAAVTYGIISTQLQWIRTDLDRQQRQIERIEQRQIDRIDSRRP
jgi:hypothetical protein